MIPIRHLFSDKYSIEQVIVDSFIINLMAYMCFYFSQKKNKKILRSNKKIKK